MAAMNADELAALLKQYEDNYLNPRKEMVEKVAKLETELLKLPMLEAEL